MGKKVNQTFVADAEAGRNTAFIDAETVSLAFVVDTGVRLYLHDFDEPVDIPCGLDEAKRIITMVADVREAQKLDRRSLEQKGDTQVVSRRAIFLQNSKPKPEPKKDYISDDEALRIAYCKKVRGIHRSQGLVAAVKEVRRNAPFPSPEGTQKWGLAEAKHWVEALSQEMGG